MIMRLLGNMLAFLSAALVSLALAILTPISARAEPAPRVDPPPRQDAPHVDTPSPRVDTTPAPIKIHEVFEVDREGDKIGATTIDIDRQNDVTTVKLATSISVKVMFIEAYHYEHASTEIWRSGQLISYKSQTDDNGTKHTVEVGPGSSPDKLSLTVDGKRSDIAKTFAPASLWSRDVVNRSDLFQTDNGKRLSIKVKDAGEETLVVRGVKRQTHHYKISDKTPGEFDRDVWFDGDLLVRMKLLGSDRSTIVSDLR